MAHPSVSKSRPAPARKAVPVTGTPPQHEAEARKTAAVPGTREAGRAASTQLETSEPVFSLPEQYWTQFIVELLKRSNLQTTTKSGHVVYVMPHEPEASALTLDVAHVAAGVEILARGILAHALSALQGQPDETRSTPDFARASSLLVRGVPEEQRGRLFQDMGRGLEEAAKGLPSRAEDKPRSAPGGIAPVSTRDFMVNLAQQETAQRARDIDDGLLVSGATLAARLGMSPQGLHHARKTTRMFALQGASGELVYPAFFADPRQDRKTLEAVSKVLGDLPGAAKWDFFMSVRQSLGNRTPLEALAKGKVDAVMAAAQAFAEA
jgi:hypothetical protein